MDLSGPNGFLWYFVAIHLMMVGFAFYRMTVSESPGLDEQLPYAPVPGRTGELAESWIEGVIEAADPGPETAAADERAGGHRT